MAQTTSVNARAQVGILKTNWILHRAMRDRKVNRGRSSIRRGPPPREDRRPGGGVTSAAPARLMGRPVRWPGGGHGAGGSRCGAPVGATPTPNVPARRQGVGAVLRGRGGPPPSGAAVVARVRRCVSIWLSTIVSNSPGVIVLNSPPRESHASEGGVRVERTRPAWRFSRSRYESPLMLMVVAWCSSRSRMALAMTASPKTSPQAPRL